jgi:hypothetical protein
MAFNLGAFAGGVAQGGFNTYKTLSDIESQKKRDELIELQAQEAKAAMEERAALKSAAGVYNKVGTNDYASEMERVGGRGIGSVNSGVGGDDFDRAVNESAAAVALENKARVEASRAGIPTDDAATWQKAQTEAAAMKPAAYTREQADTEYLAKVRGINPEKALSVEGLQTQTAIGKSSLARIKAEDDFSNWLQESQAQAAKDPVGFLKANLGAYNNAKKGSHLDDGNTASVVASADGNSFSFVRTDAKGKLVDSTPINPTTAGDALKHIAFSKYSSLPGKFKESEELGMRKTEVELKGKEFGLKEKLLPSEIAKNNAAAAQANAHAGVYRNLLDTAKTNKEAAAAMEPFLKEFAEMTPEEQAGSRGQAILLKGATAGAQKSKDLAGIVSMLRKPDRGAVSAEQEKAAYTAYNEATTPEQIKAVKAKYPDVFGQSAFSKAVAADKQKQQEASANQEVAGRPLYNTAMSDLQRMARRPMGVSTAEANAAQAELEARKGEPRMSALPSK